MLSRPPSRAAARRASPGVASFGRRLSSARCRKRETEQAPNADAKDRAVERSVGVQGSASAPRFTLERGAVTHLSPARAHPPSSAPGAGAGHLRRARIDHTATAITTAPAAASANTETSPLVVSSAGDP